MIIDEKESKTKMGMYDNNDSNDNMITTCPDCGEKIILENDAGNGFCKKCALNH